MTLQVIDILTAHPSRGESVQQFVSVQLRKTPQSPLINFLTLLNENINQQSNDRSQHSPVITTYDVSDAALAIILKCI